MAAAPIPSQPHTDAEGMLHTCDDTGTEAITVTADNRTEQPKVLCWLREIAMVLTPRVRRGDVPISQRFPFRYFCALPQFTL
jgi:hypothetical protein